MKERDPVFEISVEMEFSAAHRLPDYPGACSRIHGHNYKVVVFVRAQELDELGMVCDFYHVRKQADAVLKEFDHTLINDHSEFAETSPTGENLARYIFKRLQPGLDTNQHWLHAVEVWETDKFASVFVREDSK